MSNGIGGAITAEQHAVRSVRDWPLASTRISEARVPSSYVEMLARDGHDNVPAFLHAASGLFGDIDLRGKSVLEIGSGRGLMAVLMGMCGAGEVISLEPELVGASSGVIALQRRRIEELELSNVTVVAADFNRWQSDGRPFDFILSRASLNHLYASERHAMRDRVTFEAYVEIATKIHHLLAPGGVFVATDACRYAFFTGLSRLGVRRPWRRERTGVDWRHHQNPRTWRTIFRTAGFTDVTVRFPVPYRLRGCAPLVGTAGANFFLNGSFLLRARRSSAGR